jgi:PHP family Zn ribbon phosphoesterase
MKLAADLHIHSCLSPCGDDDMTPNNIVNMAYIKQLGAIAVTDHNSAKNLPAVAEVAKARGLVLVPGLEVQTREEVHLLCYFGELEDALRFGDVLYAYLPGLPASPDVFGEQRILNENDEIIGTEPRLLIQSLDLSIEQVAALTREYGGLVVPAHVNKSANSIFCNLGFIPPGLDFPALEVYRKAPLPDADLSGYRLIHASDAHCLAQILEPEFFVDAETCSARGVLRALGQPAGPEGLP